MFKLFLSQNEKKKKCRILEKKYCINFCMLNDNFLEKNVENVYNIFNKL